MVNASVFISHSVKDTEKQPPPDADSGQQARWRRLQVARRLRDAVREALEALGTVDVWLDQRDINPGMLWRDTIDGGLLRCDGAVLLMTPESLESAWVLKEATVLTWIKSVGRPLVIVPIFLGVRSADLAERGFGPLSLESIQALRVDIDEIDPPDETLKAKADEVAAQFAGIAADAGDSGLDLDRWAGQLTSYWQNVPASAIRFAMKELGMSEWSLSDARLAEIIHNPSLATARELLLNPWRQSLRALEQLSGLNIDWGRMRPCVQPLWVPADAIKILPLITAKPPGSRTILVAGSEPATGRDIVMRAFCGRLPTNRILAPDDTSDDPDQLIRTLNQQMVDLGVAEPGDITFERPFFLVLGDGAATPLIVERLRSQHGEVTYIVMATRGREDLLALDPQPYLLEPDLAAGAELDAKKFATNLMSLGT